MAQFLLIKKATEKYDIDDVVNIRNDEHTYSDLEKITFNIIKVEGYTADELTNKMKLIKPTVERIYRSKVGGAWTLEQPTKQDAWHSGDEKWKHLNTKPGRMTIKNMTVAERDILASKLSSAAQKHTALDHLEFKMVDDPANQTLIPELNK